MSTSVAASPVSAFKHRAFLVVGIVASLAVGAWAGRTWTLRSSSSARSADAANSNDSTAGESVDVAESPTAASNSSVVVLHFDAVKQAAAGVRTQRVGKSEAQETIAVTGKLAVDEERLAHIYSMVAGVLRESNVRIGEEIKAGRVLAMVDSKEVGAAKLDLASDRLNVSFAKTNHQWAETIHRNTQALIAELGGNPPVSELEERFRDQPMGDNRQLLVSNYAKYEQTKADFERLRTLRDQNVGVEKDYIRAKSDYESASATYQAILEQLKFTTKRELLQADQKLQEALTAERMSRALLLILGYSETEIDGMDPLAEGEGVAHYPIRAPFDGTVLAKHAVLSEHVGPEHQLYEIADLSRVWLHADLFEKDLAAVGRLDGKTLTFQTTGYGNRRFTAEIVHTGNTVDEKTRAVRLIAIAENPERILKPGMFVEAFLPLGGSTSTLQIPTAAVQGQGAEAYVFVAVDAEDFEKRPIRLGRTIATNVEVLDGLEVGDVIAVAGAFALKSELMKDLLSE